MPRVAILTGSKSDVPVLDPCVETLTQLGIEHELHVMSAHRAPQKVQQFASGAADAGFEVIIAAAGMAAHLPGVVAAWTRLPVIGVPVANSSTAVSGMDALLSIAQMPPGVPVACMAVNGAKNAALYAAAILALKHDGVRTALEKFRAEQSAWLEGEMPRDKHSTVRKMTARYGIAASEASTAVERSIIGANFGTNGYTTLPQARALIKTLRLGPGVRLLDVGAGRGWPGLYLAQATGCKTVLADVPITGLRIAVSQRNALGLASLVTVCRATGTQLPFRSASFDAIVHTDTLWWIGAKLSVLRACRRLLKPGGRLAFYTIFATPGLSDRDYRRARRSGPNHLSTRRVEHHEMLISAGLSLVEERDLTPQFLRTARAWYEGRKKYERELREADGDAYFDERQHDAIVQIRAIEDGLLRRALFVAERPRHA